ncbi:MAG: hypothetical protein JO092_00840 [Candidatus Eremiobacteraeota bacterium]|nr:hypothetical protein [Candidatus Eremiobacteraeota bacterium]
MTFSRTMAVVGASGALAVAQAGNAFASSVSYVTTPPQCTTKSVEVPSSARPDLTKNDGSWLTVHQPLLGAMPADVNDFTSRMFMFPTAFAQTHDSAVAAKVMPALPPAAPSGKDILFDVSTCAKKA